MRIVVAVVCAGACATTPVRPAGSAGMAWEHTRVDEPMDRVLVMAKAGHSGAELFEKFHADYVVALGADGSFRVTVEVDAEPRFGPTVVVERIDRAGGEVLDGGGGRVRARLTCDQAARMSREESVRRIELLRHEHPLI